MNIEKEIARQLSSILPPDDGDDNCVRSVDIDRNHGMGCVPQEQAPPRGRQSHVKIKKYPLDSNSDVEKSDGRNLLGTTLNETARENPQKVTTASGSKKLVLSADATIASSASTGLSTTTTVPAPPSLAPQANHQVRPMVPGAVAVHGVHGGHANGTYVLT